MLEDRNRSLHLYGEKTTEAIFTRIRSAYVPSVRRVLKNLETHLAT